MLSHPKKEVANLLATLGTKNDLVWPRDKWPAMRFKEGIKEGASGGHGPIGYTVENYDPENEVQFRFFKPKGFHGTHAFTLTKLSEVQTEFQHSIEMQATIVGWLQWIIAIRWLHDALIEDALDRMENHFDQGQRRTKWNAWVRFLRWLLR